MPVLQQEEYMSADTKAIEILQRRSINSLLGLQNSRMESIQTPVVDTTDVSTSSSEFFSFDQQPKYIGNAQKNYCIPVARVPLMDEFPNSPEGGQIPTYNSSYFTHLERTDTPFDKLSEYDSGLIHHPDSPDSNALSSSSTCSNIDGSITELMSGLNLNMLPMMTEYKNNQMFQKLNNGPFLNKMNSQEGSNEATVTWKGHLPHRTFFPANTFSPKIFLGGLPWDVDEKILLHTFKRFGPIKIDWPGKENNSPQPKGFVYIIFPSDVQVHYLLSVSTCDNTGNWYLSISTKKMRAKQVQIIPWDTRDSTYVKNRFARLEAARTVFVGALHGMLTAEGLAKIMDSLFGGVMFAGIDTDKYKYPIGSGRVTFDNSFSFMRAVNSAFINIETEKFRKKIQVNPYLEDTVCSECHVQQGPYFCRSYSCFTYFCRSCWQKKHIGLQHHRPLTRTKTSNGMSHLQRLKNHQFVSQTSPMERAHCNANFTDSLIDFSNTSPSCMKFNPYNQFNIN